MTDSMSGLPVFVRFAVRHMRILLFVFISILYFLLFCFLKIKPAKVVQSEEPQNYEILKLVDVQEYIPPKPKAVPVPQKIVETPQQAQNTTISENIIETEKEEETQVADVEPLQTVEQEAEAGGVEGGTGEAEIEYFPQHKITKVPVFPEAEIESKIIYPKMAWKQGIEAVVYLELFIDADGYIRRVEVLKDPGYGFADSAVAAFIGIKCEPAEANGVAVPVRFRRPVRFKISK